VNTGDGPKSPPAVLLRCAKGLTPPSEVPPALMRCAHQVGMIWAGTFGTLPKSKAGLRISIKYAYYIIKNRLYPL